MVTEYRPGGGGRQGGLAVVAGDQGGHNAAMADRATPILALDLGAKRIGVAVSDPGRQLALPLATIAHVNRDADLKAIAALAAEQGAGLIVLGLPRRTDDREGPEAEKARRFGQRLQRFLGLPVVYVDEWETTAEVHERLIAADISRGKRRQVVDKLAAALILERYLQGRGVEPDPGA